MLNVYSNFQNFMEIVFNDPEKDFINLYVEGKGSYGLDEDNAKFLQVIMMVRFKELCSD